MHFIYKIEKGKEKTTKNVLFEEKKRTAEDMYAIIASFNELVVAHSEK